MTLTYSFCTTVFNSVETIERFLRSLQNSRKPHEIIVVDNCSRDGTSEVILRFPDVTLIREKCTRGLGRQIAINRAKNEIIVMLDADVEYTKLDELLDLYEESDKKDLLWNAVTPTGNGTIPVVIVKRELIISIGGYPNINAAEDSYLRLLTEKLGFYYRLQVPDGCFNPLPIRGYSSVEERRYAKSLFERVIRRLLFTRDTLFVHDLTLSELLKFYKLSGTRGWFIGSMEYLVAKILKMVMKEDTVSQRIQRLVKDDGVWN